jgi:hypothetical protein
VEDRLFEGICQINIQCRRIRHTGQEREASSKQQAASSKQQAASTKHQAASSKHQAPSSKQSASSHNINSAIKGMLAFSGNPNSITESTISCHWPISSSSLMNSTNLYKVQKTFHKVYQISYDFFHTRKYLFS